MTAQVHEDLLLEGRRTSMTTCPPIPAEHPRIECTAAPPLSTACWRGYVGQWEIREGRLYLLGVEGRYRLLGEEPLFAAWVSGVLTIPAGAMLQYVHMGFASVFEQELHLEIEEGAVRRARLVDNRRQRATPWQDEYRPLLERLLPRA